MKKNPNKTAAARMEDPAGNLAVTLLAYNDMGSTADVERLLAETDRAVLGRAMVLWYQMCVTERGKEAVAKAVDIIGHKVRLRQESWDNTQDHKEVQRQLLAPSIARLLLIHLSKDDPDRFLELWMTVSKPETAVQTAAVILGFASSVLNPSVATADCE